METITSPQNPRLKLVRRLATRRGRLRENAFVVEGEDLVAAGINAAWPTRAVLCDADAEFPRSFAHLLQQPEVSLVPGRLLASVAGLAHPPRVLGVFELPQDVSFAPGVRQATTPGLYLDGIRDPGNVGTVLRSARAFGIGAVTLGPHCADPFSPKATRASMGAVFAVTCRFAGALDDDLAAHSPIVALDANGEVPLYDVPLGKAPLLCVGSERSGLSDELRSRADVVASIPQVSGIDSLNAAAVAAIALYEMRRQQQVTDTDG